MLSSLVWCQLLVLAVPPPAITSLNGATLFDPDGGRVISVLGTNLGGVTSAQIGDGTTWTACTIGANTSTAVDITLPTKAAGSWLVRVTTAAGTSNTLSIKSWSPKQLTGANAYFDTRKGVGLTGSRVTSWTDQITGLDWHTYDTSGAAPLLVSNAFGTCPGMLMAPASGAVPAQALTNVSTIGGATPSRVTALSVFALAKWTDTDTTADGYSGNPPLALFGDLSGSVIDQFGASGGALRKMVYIAGTGWTTTDRGSGLNDGNPHMVGTTYDVTTHEHAIYVGATVQGATWTATLGSPGYTTIGGAYSGVNYGEDGFRGTIGWALSASGVISSADLADLREWSLSVFGAA